MHIAAWLGAMSDDIWRTGIRRIGAADVVRLEAAIDRMTRTLADLRGFVLPGGGRAGAAAHICRAVCRRVERRLVALIEIGKGDIAGKQSAGIAAYVNRLSDYLFVVARFCNSVEGRYDELWSDR